MKILVTGAKGFIGRNICLFLAQNGHTPLEYDLGNTDLELEQFVREADAIIHLAGINRPLNPEEFLDGNVNFTKKLLDTIKKAGRNLPLVFSSSTQASLDNPYGKSKKAAEDEVFAFAKEFDNPVFVYRFYNVFGKWCRPNYNSVIATFCYNVAHDIPLKINEAAGPINFVYIDDICKEMIKVLSGDVSRATEPLFVEPHYSVTLKELSEVLYFFKDSRTSLQTCLQDNGFYQKLYSTYLSYLEEDNFVYPLTPHKDLRGSFTEFLKTEQYGQVSVNVSKPGITKGNHYHNSKNEKYLVVKGVCEIKLRKVFTDDVISIICDDKDLRVVDIPPGYTHSIKNIGKEDSVTIMWANELYDPKNPDTFFLPVEGENNGK